MEGYFEQQEELEGYFEYQAELERYFKLQEEWLFPRQEQDAEAA